MCLPKQDDGLIFQFEIKTQLILNFGIDLSRVDLALLIIFLLGVALEKENIGLSFIIM